MMDMGAMNKITLSINDKSHHSKWINLGISFTNEIMKRTE
jgi:hypothetical protein